MQTRNLFIPALVFTLVACSADTPKKDPELEAANKCTNEVVNVSKAQAAKGIRGSLMLSSIPRATSKSDGAFLATEVVSIPYATSTYLDNGVEGSAWRKCKEQTMRENAKI